jgi:hypothetical protein
MIPPDETLRARAEQLEQFAGGDGDKAASTADYMNCPTCHRYNFEPHADDCLIEFARTLIRDLLSCLQVEAEKTTAQEQETRLDHSQYAEPLATAAGNQPVPAIAALVLEATAAAEAMNLVDFNERKQEFWCRVCRYRDPLHGGSKLHDDNCPYREFVAVMGRLHALATGQPNFQSTGESEQPMVVIRTTDLNATVQNNRGKVRVQFALYEPDDGREAQDSEPSKGPFV